MFVIGTDTHSNVIYMGMGDDHPGLYRSTLFIPNTDVHWVRPDLTLQIGQQASYEARIRFRQKLEPCTLYQTESGLYIDFEKPQRGITPGQFAAWYAHDELIGSGVIQ
jgi:tRNA-specific 2-thiouridylase